MDRHGILVRDVGIQDFKAIEALYDYMGLDGLGCSVAILELAGFLIPAAQVLGFVASGIETLIGFI